MFHLDIFIYRLILGLSLFFPLTISANDQEHRKEFPLQPTRTTQETATPKAPPLFESTSQYSSRSNVTLLQGEEEEESELFIPTALNASFNRISLSSHPTKFFGKAEILREGSGIIGFKGLNSEGWPAGYSYKKPAARYKKWELGKEYFPNYSEKVLSSWDPKEFTSLSNLRKGQQLHNFKLVVHGLELKHLDNNLSDMSFDDFIKQQLNPSVPLGNDFIPLYPYFFHKKTIISASVICEQLTATFGEAGFVLTVPVQNYVCGDKKDIHTPTDIDFYQQDKVEQWRKTLSLIPRELEGKPKKQSVGEVRIESLNLRKPLPHLSLLLPAGDNSQATRLHRFRKEMEDVDVLVDADPLMGEEDKLFLKSMTEAIIKQAQERKSEKEDLAVSQQSRPFTVTYNEVAISPIRKNKDVLISGIFFRSARENLEVFLRQQHIQKLMETATAFDLPIILIHDGNKYNTSGAGGLQE
ncbi:MAG: hypothetical protein K0M45_04740 [Candidatus Paracaedibacteraceae bacterium]|nr:hypothetical protein [Candidatus Paracaedibacteraceae bacterium]